MWTDIANICGQYCRSDRERVETWRLRIHLPILFGYMGGALVGALTYQIMSHYSLLLPVFATGGAALLYLFTPFINEAKSKLREVELLNDLHIVEHIEMENKMTPSKKLEFQQKLDWEMKQFMSDVDGSTDPESGKPIKSNVLEDPYSETTKLL